MTVLDPSALPDRFASSDALDDFLTLPSQVLVDELATVEGDLMILGVAGKMGPTLARLAQARDAVAARHRRRPLQRRRRCATGSTPQGVETIACDLLDRAAIAALPDAPNVIFVAGHKFGASGNAPASPGR